VGVGIHKTGQHNATTGIYNNGVVVDQSLNLAGCPYPFNVPFAREQCAGSNN
jgi:hypothetical protein